MREEGYHLESVKKALPERVKVGGFWYSIEAADDEMDIRGAYGYTEHIDLAIKLDTKPPQAKVRETLLHEIIHTAADFLPRQEALDEKNVQLIARVLFQVFTENPEVRKFIFEEDNHG